MTITPHIEAGQRYTHNGVTVDVHMIRDGQVCYRVWPKGVDEMQFLDNLYRIDINEFVTRIAKDGPVKS